jgi:hypothetical protein
MSHVLNVLLRDDLAVKRQQVDTKPKIGEHPSAKNLKRSLGIKPDGSFTKSQATKASKTK